MIAKLLKLSITDMDIIGATLSQRTNADIIETKYNARIGREIVSISRNFPSVSFQLSSKLAEIVLSSEIIAGTAKDQRNPR